MSLVDQRKGKFLGYKPVFTVKGIFLRYEPIYEKKSFTKMTVASTLNTDVVCRNCMGQGFILNNSSSMGLLESVCPHCFGSKRMKSV